MGGIETTGSDNMKTLVYGTKEKWDGIFLTAFSLESEDAKAFASRFEDELGKETHDIVGVRLWREEQEGGRVILYGWYRYDHDEAKGILGENHYVLGLIETAIENTAKDFGYQTVRKSHSAQVPLAASERRRLARKLIAVAEMLADDDSDVLLEGMRIFAKQAMIRQLGVQGPFKVIGGVRMHLWEGKRYHTGTNLMITARGTDSGMRISVGGTVDGRNVNLAEDMVFSFDGANAVATALRIIGRKIGFWSR